MKTYFLGLALLAFVSAVAIQGLHARTTTPPVYVVVEIDEITDARVTKSRAFIVEGTMR